MSERNSVYLFKGTNTDTFHAATEQAVTELGGNLQWDARPHPYDSNLLTSHHGNVHAAYIHVSGFEIARAIGRRLSIPWINVRIQEGALWDYSLYRGESHLDNFSTLPEYWDDAPESTDRQRGNAQLLADTWSISPYQIERYLVSWGYEEDESAGIFRTTLRGKAYKNDKHEYGDIWQMTDFIRALGAHDPNIGQPHSIPRLLEIRTATSRRMHPKRNSKGRGLAGRISAFLHRMFQRR